jgi:hypothetical protein
MAATNAWRCRLRVAYWSSFERNHIEDSVETQGYASRYNDFLVIVMPRIPRAMADASGEEGNGRARSASEPLAAGGSIALCRMPRNCRETDCSLRVTTAT